jgi:translation elongation factor EF-1alpha
MDDTGWSEERFEEIKGKITPFLKSSGFNIKNAVRFLPASGMTGSGIAKPVKKEDAPWNKFFFLFLFDTLVSFVCAVEEVVLWKKEEEKKNLKKLCFGRRRKNSSLVFRHLSLLDTLDDLVSVGRKHDAPVRFPILDKFKDSGFVFCFMNSSHTSHTSHTTTSHSVAPSTCLILPQSILCCLVD